VISFAQCSFSDGFFAVELATLTPSVCILESQGFRMRAARRHPAMLQTDLPFAWTIRDDGESPFSSRDLPEILEQHLSDAEQINTRSQPAAKVPTPPPSVDRTRSPAAVSRKREYFKYPPETIGDFAPAAANFGARRRIANSQKPAIGGHC
jgi:hypothetical protein